MNCVLIVTSSAEQHDSDDVEISDSTLFVITKHDSFGTRKETQS